MDIKHLHLSYTISFFAGLASALTIVYALDEVSKLNNIVFFFAIIVLYGVGYFSIWISDLIVNRMERKSRLRLNNKSMFVLDGIAKTGYHGIDAANFIAMFHERFSEKNDSQEYYRIWERLERDGFIRPGNFILGHRIITTKGLFYLNKRDIMFKSVIAIFTLIISVLSYNINYMIFILALIVLSIQLYSIIENNLKL